MATTAPPGQGLRQLVTGAGTQANVIGALLMREIHTRYGRDNIGYLWMFGEPALLAIAVAILHGLKPGSSHGAISPVPFAIGGYTAFIIFRGIIGRAESTIESNAPLLYHRRVTLFDMLLARALLEVLGIATAQVVLLGLCAAIGYGELPARPLVLMAGMFGLAWFSFALSMLVCAGTYRLRFLEKIIHPTVYILLPLSGAFYLLHWVPHPFREWLSWFPMVQFFEMIHAGQFEIATLRYVQPVYLVGWNLFLTYLGMVALRVVRRHVHLS